MKVNPAIYLPPSENFIELCESLLKEFYQELEKNSDKILLIGGCTPLCLKYITMMFQNVWEFVQIL
jgi:hypothetical protein